MGVSIRRGGGSVLRNQFEGGVGGFELSDQLLDPDVPTLASQDKLKVSPKGLPFVILHQESLHYSAQHAPLPVETIKPYDDASDKLMAPHTASGDHGVKSPRENHDRRFRRHWILRHRPGLGLRLELSCLALRSTRAGV